MTLDAERDYLLGMREALIPDRRQAKDDREEGEFKQSMRTHMAENATVNCVSWYVNFTF